MSHPMTDAGDASDIGRRDRVVSGLPGTRWLRRQIDTRPAWFFLSPAIVVLLLLSIFPFIYSFWLSFHQWNLSDRTAGWTFVGFGNYVRILTGDPYFWSAARVTLAFLLVTITLEFLLGLGIATVVSQESRALGAIQTIVVLPMMITPVVVGLIWRFMYNPDHGIINYVLGKVGIAGPAWLGDARTGFWAVVVADVWEWTPFMALILLAAMQSLPREPLEAAVVDGASRWQAYRSIVLPLLRPAIGVALLLRGIDAFKTFDLIYVLTQGGPGTSTQVLSLYTYKWGFKFFELGYAAALAYLMVLAVDLAATFGLRALERRT
ncbi:MAG: sugar ABC transporter permease [Thermomicrobiales bacterium]|nr:sugar ABC transporter permease [Thermomicrobiales bacterium]